MFRAFNGLMLATLWISGCAILPVALTIGASAAFDCIILFILSSIWFMMPISDRS